MENLKPGSILVANPALEFDPAFGWSVIVLINHDERGTLGVNIAVAPDKDGFCFGGPLLMPLPFILGKSAEAAAIPDGAIGDTGYYFQPLLAGTGADEKETVFVVVSYAGWSQERLADEIEMGVWVVSNKTLAEVISTPADQRWAVASEGLVFAELF